MSDELYCDGIGEITVTGMIVRMDMVTLSPAKRDANGNPEPVFKQRIIMPVDAFANSVDLMQKALSGLVDAGVVRRNPSEPIVSSSDGEILDGAQTNSSPNFN